MGLISVRIQDLVKGDPPYDWGDKPEPKKSFFFLPDFTPIWHDPNKSGGQNWAPPWIRHLTSCAFGVVMSSVLRPTYEHEPETWDPWSAHLPSDRGTGTSSSQTGSGQISAGISSRLCCPCPSPVVPSFSWSAAFHVQKVSFLLCKYLHCLFRILVWTNYNPFLDSSKRLIVPSCTFKPFCVSPKCKRQTTFHIQL